MERATARFGKRTPDLTPAEVHDLVTALRDNLPAFFKPFRLDVCSHYLTDPGVWARIGFPGPSTAARGRRANGAQHAGGYVRF